MRFNWTTTAVAMMISGAVSAQISNPGFLSKEKAEQNITIEYWTEDRMKNAQPMPLPQVDPAAVQILQDNFFQTNNASESGDGAPPEDNLPKPALKILFTPEELPQSMNTFLDHGTLNNHFSSSRLVPLTADTVYPYSTTGKLFFTIPNQGDFVCSASVIRHRIVVTAGHCLHSGSKGGDGFYSNWRFVPAYRDGAAPLGTWNWSFVMVTDAWATGRGTVPNAADYGMLEMSDQVIGDTERRIGTVTGYLGYQTESLNPNHAHILGYPCNLDNCQKMHQVTAQSARNTSPNNVEYGSDMRGGSSGGPWIQNFGALANGQNGGLNPGLNRIIGITSYGYVDAKPKIQGSAIPDARFTTILNTLCARKAGNCS